MCSRSRAVAECSTSCTGSIRNARNRRFELWSNNQISQPNSRRYSVVDIASARATGSGRAMARFFGNSSPKSICTSVENTIAKTAPIAMPTPVGTFDTAEQHSDALADQRFGDIADQQTGDGDAELRAREHERRSPGHRQRALRSGVPGFGPGLEP